MTATILTETVAPAPAVVTDYKKLRDPFLEPAVSQMESFGKTDLELFGSTEFKLTGVITGPFRMRAILVSPKGKSFIVNEGMKIGQRNGAIRKITTRSVIVVEEQVNELGEIEKAEMEIALDAEDK